jgi:hypothetical protein
MQLPGEGDQGREKHPHPDQDSPQEGDPPRPPYIGNDPGEGLQESGHIEDGKSQAYGSQVPVDFLGDGESEKRPGILVDADDHHHPNADENVKPAKRMVALGFVSHPCPPEFLDAPFHLPPGSKCIPGDFSSVSKKFERNGDRWNRFLSYQLFF